jgi:superfamily II DNA or RNA helicase
MTVDATLAAPDALDGLVPPLATVSAPAPTPTPRQLRGYQIEAADAVTAAFARGVVGPAVVLPTGSGKSTVIAELVRRETTCGNAVLLMAHRNELIEQMADAVIAVNPTGPVPSLIGGSHRDSPAAQVVSATVQSLQRSTVLAALGSRDLVICDEAHHSVTRTYLKVFEHFSDSRRAGFTATMTRLAPVKGEPPLRDIWNEVVYECDLIWAVEQGFLIAPSGVTVELPDLDVDALHPGDGEITDNEAEAAMMRATTLNATVEAVAAHTAGLSTIVFGASMQHCREVTAALVSSGVTAEMVVGETSAKERTGIYRRFRTGQTHVLVTVDVLTEGADFPSCEAVVLARPTRSQSRLVQCVGRALRPHTFDCGRVKDRALVVDLVGAGSLGLIVQTELDRTHVERTAGCQCAKPCAGDCDPSCTGRDCDCVCVCLGGADGDEDDEAAAEETCTCTCANLTFGLCRCGCGCTRHRVDPLVVFDPLTGQRSSPTKRRRGDSPWTQRTATVRWAAHPRGLARPVYRSTGHKGVLMLADMRGVAGTTPGRDWAFGFFDNTIRRMTWVNTSGQWQEPATDCYLQGFSLAEADALANQLFPSHMRDQPRREPSAAQISMARALGVAGPDGLDRRDLSDMLALARADVYLPTFTRSVSPAPGRNQN